MNVMDFWVDIAVNGDGKLIFVAGSPSVGKSTLMTLIAKALALWGVPVGYFSLEMPCEQLARKMMLPYVRLDEDKLIFTTELQCAGGKTQEFKKDILCLAKSPLYVDDTAQITIDSLHEKAKRLVEQNNVKLIIIDYGQLIKEFLPYGDKNSLFERLRNIAVELNIPVVVMFQFTPQNRCDGYESDIVRILGKNVTWEEYADAFILLSRRKGSRVTDIKINDKSDKRISEVKKKRQITPSP